MPVRYIHGHYNRVEAPLPEPVSGPCACGCGQIVTPSTYAHRARKYVYGHSTRKSQVPYVVQDRGYPGGPCWAWQLTKGMDGYGRIRRWRKPDIPAHRAYYEAAKGPIPDGLPLDHLCRQPDCVNPDHLEPVTVAENTRRGRATKLTAAQVVEIRRLAGTMANKEIAARFSISRSYVAALARGKKWRLD